MRNKEGLLFGAAAYFIWGLAPIYFKWLAHVPAAEVLAHRIAWSLPVCVLLLWLLRKPQGWIKLLRSPDLLRQLALSATLVSINWFVFVWAVANDRILDTSLGYFINPLITIALGVVVLRERLGKFRLFALGFACLGVTWQIVVIGGVPWVSLGLAVSFALYGLLRKQIAVTALDGLAIETLMLAPLALAYIVWLVWNGQSAFAHLDLRTDFLLASAGFVTVIPLAMFAVGARVLALNTMGFLQYIAPTCTLFLAIFVYQESFTLARLASFSCIWFGLLLLAIDGLRKDNTP